MLERVIRISLTLGAVAPGLFLSKLIGDRMLAGLSKGDAVVMSLGYLAPISWLFLLGLLSLEILKNKRPLRNG